MTDKELADKIVALGVGKKSEPHMFGDYMVVNKAFPYRMETEYFVRDWRVCGALIEKCQKIYIEYIGDPEQTVYARSRDNRTWDWLSGESVPRMVSEACVIALTMPLNVEALND